MGESATTAAPGGSRNPPDVAGASGGFCVSIETERRARQTPAGSAFQATISPAMALAATVYGLAR
jgi:hypothetical protein